MKKIMLTALIAASVSGCGNLDIFDTNYTFDTAYVRWPNGEMKTIPVKQWKDYENGEQIQIISTDGCIYLISSVNAVLVRHK